jgi:hypothetical protein
MRRHPRPGLVSRDAPPLPISSWTLESPLESILLIGAGSLTSSSHHSLSVFLISDSILARVAFLPNESYAGRADIVLHTFIIPASPIYPPGFLRPGIFLITNYLHVQEMVTLIPQQWRLGHEPARDLPLAGADDRIREIPERFEKAR